MTALARAAVLMTLPALALAHGHPGNVDPAHPEAWKYKLCGEMVTVAVQALHDRERQRPMKRYEEDGSLPPRIANEIIAKINAEASIASPKRAESFGRAYCMEQLQDR